MRFPAVPELQKPQPHGLATYPDAVVLFDRFDELGAGPGSLLLEFLVEERPDLGSDLLGLVGCWGVGETIEASLCPSFLVVSIV